MVVVSINSPKIMFSLKQCLVHLNSHMLLIYKQEMCFRFTKGEL